MINIKFFIKYHIVFNNIQYLENFKPTKKLILTEYYNVDNIQASLNIKKQHIGTHGNSFNKNRTKF